MKRKFWLASIVLSTLICGSAAIGFSACGGKSDDNNSSKPPAVKPDPEDPDKKPDPEDPDDPKPPVESDKITAPATATVVEFETYRIPATVDGEGVTLEWTSDNESIVTVDQTGLITGVKAGTANVKIKAGSEQKTCAVTVTATPYLHSIEFNVDSIQMYRSDSAKVAEITVMFRGEELSGNYSFEWIPVDDADDYVTVTPSADGMSASFEAKAVGRAEYVVSGKVRGYDVEGSIMIAVLSDTISYGFENPNFIMGQGGYDLGLTLGSETTDRETIGKINCSLNGAPDGELENVDWVSSSTDIAEVVDGVIIAKGAGRTAIVGTTTHSGETVTLTVFVEVGKADRTIDAPLPEYVAYTASFANATDFAAFPVPTEIQGQKIVKISSGNTVMYEPATPAVAGDSVTLTKVPARAADLGKNKQIIIETDIAVYTCTADLYTMRIGGIGDFLKWQEVAAKNAVQGGLVIAKQEGVILDGYFLLDGDVDLSDPWTPYKSVGQIWAVVDVGGDGTANLPGAIKCDWTSPTIGFKGIFDGQNHVIDNLSVNGANSGFILNLGEGGKLHNVSFTNASVSGSSSIVATAGGGEFSNVYVQPKSIENGSNGNNSVFQNTGVASRIFKNVVVDLSNCEFAAQPSKIFIVAYQINAKTEGLYVIGEVPAALKASLFEGAAPNSTYGQYDGFSGLFGDTEQADALQTFSDSFWTVNGKVLLPTKVIAKMSAGSLDFLPGATECAPGRTVEVKANSNYVEYSLAANAPSGVTIAGNVVTVGDSVLPGSQIKVIATSVIDSTVTAEITITVSLPLTTLNLTSTTQINLDATVTGGTLSANGEVTIDLSEVFSQVTGTVTSVEVKLGSKTVYTKDGALTSSFTLPLSGFAGSEVGADNISIVAKSAMRGYEIVAPVNFKTKTFNSTNTPDAATFSAVLNAVPNGIYELGGNLDFGGNYLRRVPVFSGVLDGKGYGIFNTALSHSGDSLSGGWWTQFIDENTGTVKNLYIELKYMEILTGDGHMGLIYENRGTISNVALSVEFSENSRQNLGESANRRAGALTWRNWGTVQNCIVSGTVKEGRTVEEGAANLLAVYNQWGTAAPIMTDCYAVNNGFTNLLAISPITLFTDGIDVPELNNIMDVRSHASFNADAGWDEDTWIITDDYILPKALYNKVKDEIPVFSNTDLDVHRGDNVTLGVTGATFYKIELDGTYDGVVIENGVLKITNPVNGTTVAAGTTVKVKATSLIDATKSSTIEFNVLSDNLTVLFQHAGSLGSNGVNSYTLSLSLNDPDSISYEFGKIYAIVNGVESTDELDVSWSTHSGLTVADGVASATVAGSYDVTGTATYNGAQITIAISVTVSDLAAEEHTLTERVDLIFGKTTAGKATAIVNDELATYLDEGDSLSVKYGSNTVYSGVYSESTPIEVTGIPAAMSGNLDVTMIVRGTGKNYELTVPVLLITKEFTSENTANATAFANAIKSNVNGYYILSSNLEFTGDDLIRTVPTFTGTLDGRGHVIKSRLNYNGDNTNWRASFITTNVGIVKNIGFKLEYDKWVNNGYAALVRWNFGTISNVYLDVTITESLADSWGEYGILTNQNGGVIENCLVNINLDKGATISTWTNGQSNVIKAGALSYRNIVYTATDSGGPGADKIPDGITVESNNTVTGTSRHNVVIFNGVANIKKIGEYGVNSDNVEYDNLETFVTSKTLAAADGWSSYWKQSNGTLTFGDNHIITAISTANATSASALSNLIKAYPDGYFVVTEDINCGGQVWTAIDQFRGVLDGKGHAISNFRLGYGNFDGNYRVYAIRENYGTIKNIALVNVSFSQSGGNGSNGFISQHYGKISNVYLSGKFNYVDNNTLSAETGFLCYRITWKGTISNVVVDVNAADGTTLGQTYGAIACRNQWIGYAAGGGDSGTISNSYAITHGNTNIVGVRVGSDGTTPPTDNATKFTAYDSASSLTAASFDSANGWNGYWTIADGTVKFGNTVIYAPAA